MARGSLVSVVDDDASMRSALPDFLEILGYSAKSFASAEEFLASAGSSGRNA
jgi:FixJ family two-component response regulator